MTMWPDRIIGVAEVVEDESPDDLDSFVYELGDRGRELLDGVLPEGFTLRQQKNGKWVGKWPRGACKDTDRRWVESLLFMVAADPAPASTDPVVV